MVIARPVTKTKISTTGWGVPITDEVNRLSTEVDRMSPLVTAPTDWVTPTLSNGWVNESGRPAQYCKIGIVVYIRGVVSNGTMGAPAFVLPVGFRPSQGTDFAIVSGPSASHGALGIQNTGNVVPYGGANTGVFLTCSFVL